MSISGVQAAAETDSTIRGRLSQFIALPAFPKKLILAIFLLGLCARTVVFVGTHAEGDELIYMSLVSQLDQGRGYTLRGAPLLEQGFIDHTQYDRPLFFHPPGGIALQWLFFALFGRHGFPLVQVFSYALFFWSMMLLAHSLRRPAPNLMMILVAALSAFSPIMAHVTTKYWLDGPLLAFTTLSVALFAWAAAQHRAGWVLVSGLLMGYASLIKVTAFLIVPAALLMAWFLLAASPKPAGKWRRKQLPAPSMKLLRYALLYLAPAAIVQLPWELWQWIVYGSPFPGWAGRPSASLIATNSYVHYLTVVRPPWVYLTLSVRVLWTLIPAGLLYVALWRQRSTRRLGTALIAWILTVLLFHVVIGGAGYSKVLRYIILVTPASIILFSLLLHEAIQTIAHRIDRSYRVALISLVAVSLFGFFMEIAAGLRAAASYTDDLIVPIVGRPY